MILRPCCPRHSNFSFRMKRLLASHRANEHWTAPLDAKNGCRHVDISDVDQPASPNPNPRIAIVIDPHRVVVVYAGSQIAEVRGRQILLRQRLKFENIQRLVGTGNDGIFRLDTVDLAQKFIALGRSKRKEAENRAEMAGRSKDRTGG